uniref:Uncharacterized protein n=1 Tax=Romanomermis culicivorax TaxID=13658 RepID=A0A915K362_ROMCU
MMSSNSLLEGMNLYNESASPGSFDLILDQCPNLRYFAVDILNAEQIRKLPLKAPNLRYFLIRMLDYRDLSQIGDAFIYALQNLPNLRQLFIPLFIPAVLYNSLFKPIKRLSRQKRLSIITGWPCCSSDDLIDEWIHLCCQGNPST